jgi:hypothetical protein
MAIIGLTVGGLAERGESGLQTLEATAASLRMPDGHISANAAHAAGAGVKLKVALCDSTRTAPAACDLCDSAASQSGDTRGEALAQLLLARSIEELVSAQPAETDCARGFRGAGAVTCSAAGARELACSRRPADEIANAT